MRKWQWLQQVSRLMVGIPDYQQYLQHMQSKHPELTPLSMEEFFNNRQQARYGGKGIKKCPC
jgi:uncharacterized short protein YbdD (DUF466 family)